MRNVVSAVAPPAQAASTPATINTLNPRILASLFGDRSRRTLATYCSPSWGRVREGQVHLLRACGLAAQLGEAARPAGDEVGVLEPHQPPAIRPGGCGTRPMMLWAVALALGRRGRLTHRQP